MSNVPSWKRSVSRIEYLYKTYQLAILTGRIVHNSAKKYKDTYGTMLIHNCERALYHGRCVQNIYVNSQETLDYRLYELAQMRAEVDNVATNAYIWLELVRSNDALSLKESDKTYRWEEQIGLLCDEIIRLIDALKRSDREKFKKYMKQETAA